MDPIKPSAQIAAHLSAAESLGSNDLGSVQKVVDQLMTTLPTNRGVFIQLQRISDFITNTRRELTSLRPTDVRPEFIVKATDELDAIVEGTAAATNRIMDAADVVMDVAGRIPKEDADKAMAAATSIYEACTFQDITGQRVTKIVAMLKAIEAHFDKLVVAFGVLDPGRDDMSVAVAALPEAQSVAASQSDIDALLANDMPMSDGDSSERSVLSGPALPGKGQSQDEIDAILSGKF